MKSTLRCPLFRDVVEELVQLRSCVQSAGNLVFTQSILLACEDTILVKEMVSQAAIGACMRSVCVRNGLLKPGIVNYKHVNYLRYLRQAQCDVVQYMTHFESDTGLTEIMNQAAREYKTVLDNSVWMHFRKWQVMTVKAELLLTNLPKVAYRYVTKQILKQVNRASIGPDPTRYKSEVVRNCGVQFVHSRTCLDIIERLVKSVQHVPDTRCHRDDWYGISSDYHIKSNIVSFLQAGVIMTKRICVIRDTIGYSGDYVLPFVPQVIPQLKYKVRSITFGTEQTLELCKYINTKYPERIHHILVPAEIPDSVNLALEVNMCKRRKTEGIIERLKTDLELVKMDSVRYKIQAELLVEAEKLKVINNVCKRCSSKYKRKRKSTDGTRMILTREQWRAVVPLTFRRIFIPPRRLERRGSRVEVVTTDGISASWHIKRPVRPGEFI